MPELIQHGVNGLLARSGDASSYVERLEQLLDDPGLRERLGAAARRAVETSFTDFHVARLAADYYRERVTGSR
jgi:glycosyltransferase involved in cell wall biosynthesis